MLMRVSLAIILVVLFLPPVLVSQQRPAADVIVTNARVWTVDADRPKAEAVAIIGQRIVAVGTGGEIDLWRGEKTKVIDAAGKLLLPGFNDAHVHFISGGLQLDSVDLRDADSPKEFASRIAEQTKKTTKGDWITGGDWDDQKFKPAALPTKELIDAITPDNPVFVNRYDGHMSLANSLALKAAGISIRNEGSARWCHRERRAWRAYGHPERCGDGPCLREDSSSIA